jgi:Transposase DDE domain
VPLADFLLHVFCLVDDLYRDLVRRPLRSRGPRRTALTDSEVITIELVGEFLGLDHDKGLLGHFRRYHAAEFPGLLRVHRTTFARQAANLYAVKRQMHARLAERLAAREPVWLVDSLPVHACAFGRAGFARRFRGEAGYGRDHTRRGLMDGFRLHARSTREGAIVAFDLAPANVSDLAMVDQLGPPPGSAGVGDRSYWSPRVRDELASAGVTFLAPFQSRKADPDPGRSRRLARVRWVIETAFGQLAERFRMKRTWARDLWHLSHRVIRKVLGHTAAVWINVAFGRSALDFDGLVVG